MFYKEKMISPITKILIICAISTFCVVEPKEQRTKLCDTTICNGTFQLDTALHQEIKVKRSKVKAIIKEYRPTFDIIMYKRSKLSVYCYDGGPADSNTGCSQEIKRITQSPMEARRDNRERRCPTGYECRPFGDCWGSDADKCFSKDMKVSVGPKTLKYLNTQYLFFTHHTCIQSWECINEKVSPNVYLFREGNKVLPVFSTQFGKRVDINDHLYDEGIDVEEGYKMTSVERNINVISYDTSISCISMSPEDTICQFDDSTMRGISFSLGADLMATYRNKFIQILDPIKTIIDGKITSIVPLKNIDPGNSKTIVIEEKSVSVESLKELVDEVSMVQHKEMYNSVVLESRINQLIGYQRDIIESLGKIDELLIGKIMSRSFQTKWINEKAFSVCPCISRQVDVHTNCDENSIYKDNGYFIRLNDTDCFRIKHGSIRNISLYSDDSLETTLNRMGTTVVASLDSSIWERLNEVRFSANIHDERESYRAKSEDLLGKMSRGLESIYDQFSLLKWLGGTSSIAAWLGLALHLRRV